MKTNFRNGMIKFDPSVPLLLSIQVVLSRYINDDTIIMVAVINCS